MLYRFFLNFILKKQKNITSFFLIIIFVLLSIFLFSDIVYCMDNGNGDGHGGGNAQTLLEWLIQIVNTSTASIQDNIQNGVQTSITAFFTLFGSLFSWLKSFFSMPTPTIIVPEYLNNPRFQTILGLEHREFLNKLNMLLPENYTIYSDLLQGETAESIERTATNIQQNYTFNLERNVNYQEHFINIGQLFYELYNPNQNYSYIFLYDWLYSVYTDTYSHLFNANMLNQQCLNLFNQIISNITPERPLYTLVVYNITHMYIEQIAHFHIVGSFIDINPIIVNFLQEMGLNQCNEETFNNIINGHCQEYGITNYNEFMETNSLLKLEISKHIPLNRILEFRR